MCLSGAARQRSVVLAGVREVFGMRTMNAGVCHDSKQQREHAPEKQSPQERGGEKKDFLQAAWGEERAMLMSWRAGWL